MTSHASLLVVLALGTLAAGCGMSTQIDPDTGHSDVDAAGIDAGPTDDAGLDGGTTPVDSGLDAFSPIDANRPDGGHRVPTYHRPDDTQCSGTAPAGNCSFGGGAGMCAMDSQCTTGTNGRCNMS